MAVKVDMPVVVPALLEITLGEACNVTEYGVVAVIATLRVSLTGVFVEEASMTCTFARPAAVVVSVAVAVPPATATV
jgi:hypothetical protein